jgi:hypothetical protein
MYIDQYGSDPLLDPVYDKMQNSGRYHTVTEGEAGNPQMLASTYYQDVNYYEFILAFNALAHASEMVTGLRLEIPTILQQVEPSVVISL